MMDTSLDAERLRAQVEIEITKQALELFKSLRQEYSDMNERLQRRVDELEKQRNKSIQRIDSFEVQHAQNTKRIEELADTIWKAQCKEQQYQETIARQDKEIAKLRKSLSALQRENVTLSRLVDELRNEVDGFRADMRGD